ncbi:aminotransferase class I/II-fold pyridoxal phosphate-dependent enzyme [Helicobacter sp. 23-1045]
MKNIAKKLYDLKCASGTHSPSIATIKKEIPQLQIKIDACFLSNPYATELFLDYLKKDLLDSAKLRYVLEFYPSQNAIIAQKLENILDISHQNIFISNGAIEAIQAVLHNFVKGKIIINIPTFSSYYEFCKDKVEVIFYPLQKDNDYQLSPKNYIDFVKKVRPQSIVLINPNNPNGGFVGVEMEEILRSLSFVENIIIDESFLHFAFDDERLSPISYAWFFKKFPNVILIKSMSKDFGIAGIRAGYAIMQKEKVEMLLKNGYLWNISGLGEYFFGVYERADFREKYEIIRKKYIKETQDFFAKLSQIKGLKVYPSKANFALVELTNAMKSQDFVNAMLLNYGIYTRNCNDKIGLEGEFIRLSSRTKDENNAILAGLKDLFGGGK